MTILRMMRRGMDRDLYYKMREMLDIDRKHPLGLIMHGAAEVDGKMEVAQVWDSEEYALRFDKEILAPIVEALGAPRDVDVTVVVLEDLVTP